MAVQVSYPGVYIEEFTPASPIQGVGTSTPAFIGIAERGPLDTPTKVTSWDRFKAVFGEQPVPGFYLWYAVRGFFENGGQVCYVVRASNGAYGKLTINTISGAKPLFDIVAREPGAVGIDGGTAPQHLLDKTKTSLFQPTGKLTKKANPGDKQIEMVAADVAKFRPGDVVTIAAGGERLTIVRLAVGAPNSTVLVDKPIANAAGYPINDTVRLADTTPGWRTFRIAMTVPLPPQALVEGAMLTFEQGANKNSQIVDSVQTEQLGGGSVTYRVTLRQGLSFPVNMTAAATVQSEEFTLSVKQGATTPYPGLALDSRHPRYYGTVINTDPDAIVTIVPHDPPPPIPMPGNMPENKALTALAGGTAENLTTLIDKDYIDALDTLRGVDDVNMVAAPDGRTAPVQIGIVDHCTLIADRLAILDCRPGLDPFDPTGILGQRAEVESARGYAALYYPWLRVPPAGRGDAVLVPPSGHVCGIFARSDNSRGVHKAPANEIVNGSLGVERLLGDIDHGQLNLSGVNVIRVFQSGGRPVLYGARTTAKDDRNWQYVNIRRLFLYLEESIQEGIRWAVFEPNNKPLWKKLQRAIGDFLEKAWRDGALFGAKATEAFYVRIDDDLNPFSEQALGRLHIEIGVRPSYPAEFIIVRIGIWAGGSEVSES